MKRNLHDAQMTVAANYERLCKDAVESILFSSQDAIAAHGRFAIALSGGSTPKGVYSLMGSRPYKDLFQWDKIHLFWSDERWVGPHDKSSNYGMVEECLLGSVDIPSRNIHPIGTTERDPATSAGLYEEELISFFRLKKNAMARFDLVLLGLGRDGHIASLFPGSPALLVKDRMVADVSGNHPADIRITLTLPVINRARSVYYVVSGPDKARILKAVLENNLERTLPAQWVKPDDGTLMWFVDQSAASMLQDAP